ncbi:hypothetical protein GQ44DRAFT_731273 [Phaeosphaeriaceae sp. PMI808]|nr:hypothetical protein GQ44DRAFT_731273 [Phaeosphaeriaceae sp. PMI808]
MAYLLCQHIARSLPPEAKREGLSESPIMLAFPIADTQEANAEPQQVYAYLPIRDYGFKFLIHADFLLTANRKDIDRWSSWSWALRRAILFAFVEEARKFSSTSLRHIWPKYIPEAAFAFDFFHMFRNEVVQNLRKCTIVESEDGQLRIPTTVTYVPKSLRDETGSPLALSTLTAHKYVSREYSELNLRHLERIGVSPLVEGEFLDDLKASLVNCSAFRSKHCAGFGKWHSDAAKALISLISIFKTKVKNIPLIRLGNGLWASASSGTLFFPGDGTDVHVPEGIQIFEIDKAVQDYPDCERF